MMEENRSAGFSESTTNTRNKERKKLTDKIWNSGTTKVVDQLVLGKLNIYILKLTRDDTYNIERTLDWLSKKTKDRLTNN